MSIKRFKNFIKSKKDFIDHTNKTIIFKDIVIQDVDFLDIKPDWEQYVFKNTIIQNCTLTQNDFIYLTQKGVFIYPKFTNLPYKPTKGSLYNWKELMEIDENGVTKDESIYNHFAKTRFNSSMNEALAQRIHDHSIDYCLRELLVFDDIGMTEKKCIGIMGGHAIKRNSEEYIKTATVSRLLTMNGYHIVTGGGPGIMEAGNYGAYMGNYSDKEFYEGLEILSMLSIEDEDTPEYQALNYTEQSLTVISKYPDGMESLAIPTWFYGHEPSNLFASHIAKYFSNSIREDILLAICLYGIIYAPGSAGTTQEIFQEATQNHYGTYGYHSPMIFFGKKRYVEETSIYSTLHQLSKGMKYNELLFLSDSPKEILDYIKTHPPIKSNKKD